MVQSQANLLMHINSLILANEQLIAHTKQLFEVDMISAEDEAAFLEVSNRVVAATEAAKQAVITTPIQV